MIEIVEHLRSLGFGALFGGGVLGLIYLLVPHLFPASIPLENVIIVGGLIGAGGHRLCEAVIGKILVRPLGRFVSYYSKLIQLLALGRFLGPKRQRELIRDLTVAYILDEKPRNTKTLPPAND